MSEDDGGCYLKAKQMQMQGECGQLRDIDGVHVALDGDDDGGGGGKMAKFGILNPSRGGPQQQKAKQNGPYVCRRCKEVCVNDSQNPKRMKVKPRTLTK